MDKLALRRIKEFMQELHYCVSELQKASRKLRILSKIPSCIVDVFPYFDFAVRVQFLYSAIIVRKILEIHKPPKIENYKIEVLRYPYINPSEPASPMMWAADYDSANCVQEKVKLRKICNSIIHSYVYNVLYQQHQKPQCMTYIGVASDFDKEKHVYVIFIKEWLDCLTCCIKTN